jgi:hypothetical protein
MLKSARRRTAGTSQMVKRGGTEVLRGAISDGERAAMLSAARGGFPESASSYVCGDDRNVVAAAPVSAGSVISVPPWKSLQAWKSAAAY